MKCFELRDDMMKEGLLVSNDAGLSCVKITMDGQRVLPLDKMMANAFDRAPKLAPIRLIYATLTKDLKSIACSRKADRCALLRIDVGAGQGGQVSLSACSFQDNLTENGVVQKLYSTFPPQGVQVLGAYDEPEPWFGDQRLELVMIMLQNASFRINRTGRLGELRQNTYIQWDGFRLRITPEAKKRNDVMTERPPLRIDAAPVDLEEHVVRQAPLETYEEEEQTLGETG